MSLNRFATLIFCTAFLLSLSVAAQETATFTSWYGSYSVQLPKNAVWITTAGLLNSDAGGPSHTYGDSWQAGNLVLQSIAILYEKADKSISPEDAASNLGRAAGSLKSFYGSYGNKLLADRTVVVNGITGREVVFDNYTREIAYRLFQVGKNAIRLRAAYPKNEKAAGIAFLSSLRLVPPELVEAQKIKEDTPPALPQTPPANRPKAVNSTKDTVARILSEKQTVNADGSMGLRKKMREIEFDRDGESLKSIDYEIDWHPPVVTVFGYLDGMRVSRTSSRDFYIGRGDPGAKRDERYSTREETAFDEKGRVTEIVIILNDGMILWRDEFKYGTNTIETISHGSEKYTARTITTLDASGEAISYDLVSAQGVVKGHGTYSKHVFDAQGNWTTRLHTSYLVKDGKPGPATSEFQYRTITYWQ